VTALSSGTPLGGRYDPPVDPERARQLLAEERRRIESSLAGRRHVDVGELADQDEPADQGSELYADELDEGISADLRGALAAVERAEQRLEQGTYGLSVESGEPIPDERLEAFPTAERTVAEQERYDRRIR
jgi:DnaK suppressor protein